MKNPMWIGVAMLAACHGTGYAQDFPDHALRLIVPFAPGSITDFSARQIAKNLSDELRQSIVVENRGGAGGIIGAKEAAAAPADGYTLFMGTVGTQIVNPILYKDLSYNPDTQFAPVGLVTRTPSILAVRSGLPVSNVKELVAYARNHPGRLNYSASGTVHIGLETLKSAFKLDIVKILYKGSGEAVTAGASGQVDIVMDGAPTLMPHVRAGKLHALAVMSDQPLAMAPGVPTTAQQGFPELQASNWTALYVPAGTPARTVEKLNAALQKALASPDLRNRVADYGTQLFTGKPEEYGVFIEREKSKVAMLIKEANIRVD